MSTYPFWLKALFFLVFVSLINELIKLIFNEKFLKKYELLDVSTCQKVSKQHTRFLALYKTIILPLLGSTLIIFILSYFNPTEKNLLVGGALISVCLLNLSCEFLWRKKVLARLDQRKNR